MRSHICWRGKRNIFYKGVETSRRENPKRTIFVSGGLGLLQMLLELDTGQCVSKDNELEGGGHRAVYQQGHWAPKVGGL